ncbi:heme-binding protein [Aureimonas fodinaquatilis]|uniref:Heme-binding protein n=1 Tax=Aureimonas fodinaquatilis TaxID=2565783 RepID=A0A5B0DWC6_9HYPH|nr:heme-binding protein [Aureimonas fodinaquatilis]KAA0970111.1 heme-binding protein [Aureimonas fodinaquatilis]
MFRDKPTAIEQLSDALSDIGDRISSIEHQISERVNPRSGTLERIRREIGRLPGINQARPQNFLSDLVSGWHLPDTDAARETLRSGAHEVGGHLRDGADALKTYLPAVAPALSSLRLPTMRQLRRYKQPTGLMATMRANPGVTTAVVAGGLVIAAGAALYATNRIAEHAEEPDYDVERQDGDIEIRSYKPMLVAETIKSGYHEKARRTGFETLFNFIRASNRSGRKIAMTTPVMQQLAEGETGKGWAIRFVMPGKYTKSTVPAPGTDDVKIVEVPARRVVAIRFSGAFSASLASRKLMAIYNYLADENLTQKGDPVYAFYNPPWTPGFLRRNEILIELE